MQLAARAKSASAIIAEAIAKEIDAKPRLTVSLIAIAPPTSFVSRSKTPAIVESASATVIAVVGPENRQPAQSKASAPLEAPPEAVGDDAEYQKDGY